jgi:hypothetical protein
MRHFFLGIGVVVLFATLLLVLWFMWLGRYLIYSRDGAKLDFSLSLDYAQGELPVQPLPEETVSIENKIPDISDEEVSTELVRFSGYYVTLTELTENFDVTRDRLLALPAGSTVMLELKSRTSYAYYTSMVAPIKPNFDTEKVDALVRALTERGYYVIAQLPAFLEYYYILEDQYERGNYGLKQVGSVGLWLDPSLRCWWMNPASDGTLAYMIQLLSELRGIGFDEVVFSDYRFPDTNQIVFNGDRMATLSATAATLVKACATDTFCVSFIRPYADLTLPAGRTRLYLTGIGAANVDAMAEKTGFEDPSIQLVFLTDLNDTRYDEYCVLRPLADAH